MTWALRLGNVGVVKNLRMCGNPLEKFLATPLDLCMCMSYLAEKEGGLVKKTWVADRKKAIYSWWSYGDSCLIWSVESFSGDTTWRGVDVG